MRLYYYTAKQWGMKSLWEKRLKIAEYADLNDPFELFPFQASCNEEAKTEAMIANVLSQNHGVICFSETWESTLMWAHYGDKHKGLCLGFEIEEGPHLSKIKYVSERLPCRINLNEKLQGINEDNLVEQLNVKHNGWEYEREQRLRASLNDKRDGIYYCLFNEGLTLREVIIGARSTLTVVDVAEAIGGQLDSDVDISKVKPAHDSFKMCFDTSLSKQTIHGLDPDTKNRRRLAEALLDKMKMDKTDTSTTTD